MYLSQSNISQQTECRADASSPLLDDWLSYEAVLSFPESAFHLSQLGPQLSFSDRIALKTMNGSQVTPMPDSFYKVTYDLFV